MPDAKKYDKILNSLQHLLLNRNIQNISVSDIAKEAKIGKGSIYYYFPSKEAILDALIERSYEEPLKTAKNLASRTEVSPFTRMAMILQACRNSSAAFLNRPAALAEIVLIVLAVKLSHTFLSATAEDSEDTIHGLVALLEKGTGVPQGTLNYLTLHAADES